MITGVGTPAAHWRDWPALHRLPSFVLPAAGRVVVVAPHPDDEVLGAGGAMALLARAGVPVELVAVTDGEASHPGSVAVTPAGLAARRVEESAAALGCLGLAGLPVHRLRQPDGAIEEAALGAALAARLTSADCCLAPWWGDGHPDHDAVGRAAVDACRRTGARLACYPVWLWHWAVPADPRVPWGQLRRLVLPPPVAAAKGRAITAFTSQLEPLGPAPADAAVLPPHVVARFVAGAEWMFE